MKGDLIVVCLVQKHCHSYRRSHRGKLLSKECGISRKLPVTPLVNVCIYHKGLQERLVHKAVTESLLVVQDLHKTYCTIQRVFLPRRFSSEWPLTALKRRSLRRHDRYLDGNVPDNRAANAHRL